MFFSFRHPLYLLLLTLFVAGCSSPQPVHASQKSAQSWSGLASYYADKYQGRKTASGERFNQKAMTAAHRTLPFGTKVRVTNVVNGKSVIVRINDRGPFVKGRIIDLSRSAFSTIGNPASGTVKVRITIVK